MLRIYKTINGKHGFLIDIRYRLSYNMLVHNVECVDYNVHEEAGLNVLLDGIQIVFLPIGLRNFKLQIDIFQIIAYIINQGNRNNFFLYSKSWRIINS